MGKESALSCERAGGWWCAAQQAAPSTTMDIRPLFMKQHSIIGCYLGSKKELLDVLNLVEFGRLKPVVDSIFPLKEAAAAQQKMLNRRILERLY